MVPDTSHKTICLPRCQPLLPFPKQGELKCPGAARRARSTDQLPLGSPCEVPERGAQAETCCVPWSTSFLCLKTPSEGEATPTAFSGGGGDHMHLQPAICQG